MRASRVPPPAFDVVGDLNVRIEDVVDREDLFEMCRSAQALFGLGVRVYSSEGALLANEGRELSMCGLVNETAAGRAACGATVNRAKSVDPLSSAEVSDGYLARGRALGADHVVHACFTGLAYRIVPLVYETRHVGRIVLGPYAPADMKEAPALLVRTLPTLDRQEANARLLGLPRFEPSALAQIAQHLKTALEVIIFSSHKAYLTSKMHLYSVRESYRTLEEKNERLEEALARLKELDRLKSNFLGTVSHELRTPLTSIIGYSEMLADGIAGPLATEQAEFVDTIHRKGEQLLALIVGLLDLSKLESGTMSLRYAPMQIGPTLKEVVSTLAPGALKKGVEVELALDRTFCELAGDAERLRQVFVNLVDNAVKFTPKGGKVTVTATVRTIEPGALSEVRGTSDVDDIGIVLLAAPHLDQKAVEVTITDTGIGIPPADRAKVFDAFYQVDSSATREHGGTGLGLSIVRRIVEAHHGVVSVQANEPQGTIFVVTLPSAHARRVMPSRVPPAVRP